MNKEKTMGYEEYVGEVKKYFGQYSYSKEQVAEYFDKDETKQLLKKEYDGYAKGVHAGHEPSAVAYCLDMMY